MWVHIYKSQAYITKFRTNQRKTSESIGHSAIFSAWEVSKHEVFSGPYFPVFGLNTGKYGPGKTPYLDNFHAVFATKKTIKDYFLWIL